MKDVKKIRNFVVAGHSGSGKTMLCETMLFKAGAIDRLGRIDQKNTVSDYTPEEQVRQSSIYATPLSCEWNGNNLFFIDTPGYGEFISETISSLYATDITLLVIDGINGIEVGTNRAWRLSKELKLPRCIFINNLDNDRADYFDLLNQIQDAYGKTVCIPITVPTGKGEALQQVVHVLRDKEIPAELEDFVTKYREQLMDTIAESDEDLMTRYLDGEELSEEEISIGLHKAIVSGHLVPVFAGSVNKDVGIDKLMNGVVNLFPSPHDVGVITLENGETEEISIEARPKALVFKSIIDPFVGQLNYLRVVNGMFQSDCDLYNITTGSKERCGSLLLMDGKVQTPVTEVCPGAIVAVAKLKDTHTNNTLSMCPNARECLKIRFPHPVMSYAISSQKSGEEDKIAQGLLKLSESDPTITFKRHEETHELLLSGMGDQHLANVVKKLKENYKVGIDLHTPKVPYRETITANGEGHYRHKKQTGGAGQFAEVFMRITPNPDGFEFSNDVVGGNIPRNYIPAVEKGVNEAMVNGPLVGCVVENIKVSIYDGKYHPVDSNEMAFKIAGRGAFREAMQKAKPVLMEPIMTVKITIPNDFMGDITGDLNHKRGRILGMDSEEGLQVVNAEVPLAEMSKYATELRSMTQGRGLFEMEFSRYEQVPSNVASDVMARFQTEQTEES